MLQHEQYGCDGLWCVTREQAYPFVFRPRRLKVCVPCAQLVYCRTVDDFVRFAKLIGLFLARRMQLLVMLDANGPIAGVAGKYKDGKRRYFLGRIDPG